MRYPSGFLLDASFSTSALVTALFGPSGSGKTSILSVIAGLRRPDEGIVRIGSRVLFDSGKGIHVRPEARRIGYVFQDGLLFPHMTVRDNLMYGWRRKPKEARMIDFERAVEILELRRLLVAPSYILSGGERQRVALGRALLCGPEMLLLDEPVASLDDPLKKRVLDYVQEALKEWHIPTLWVTHNLADVRRLAQHVIFVDQGRVKCTGDAESAFQGKGPAE
jgi:molybdate transport system ATP-binding protein